MNAKNIQVGQYLSWGNPTSPQTGIVKSISQNGEILFVEHTNRRNDAPKYATIERREILHVVEVAHDVQQ